MHDFFRMDFQFRYLLPPALDVSLVNPGIFGRLGLTWFAAVITRKAQKKHNRLDYDYSVILNVDEITRSMKLPLNKYSAEDNSVVGVLVLLEPVTAPSRVNRSRRALTSVARYKELSE